MSTEAVAASAPSAQKQRRRDTVLAGLEEFRRIDPGITVTGIVTFLYVCENEGISMTELASVAGLGDVDLGSRGYVVAALIALTWLVSVAVWRLGRIEQRWALPPGR